MLHYREYGSCERDCFAQLAALHAQGSRGSRTPVHSYYDARYQNDQALGEPAISPWESRYNDAERGVLPKNGVCLETTEGRAVMPNTDLCFLNVTELAPLVRARKIS